MEPTSSTSSLPPKWPYVGGPSTVPEEAEKKDPAKTKAGRVPTASNGHGDQYVKDIPNYYFIWPTSMGISLRMLDSSPGKGVGNFSPVAAGAIGNVYTPSLKLGPVDLGAFVDGEIGMLLPHMTDAKVKGPFYGAAHIGAKVGYEKLGEGIVLVGAVGGAFTVNKGEKKEDPFLSGWRGGPEAYVGVEVGLFPFRIGLHHIWGLSKPYGELKDFQDNGSQLRLTIQLHY